MSSVLPTWLSSVVREDEIRTIDPPFLYFDADHNETQSQTAETFSFKWAQSSTFEREEFRSNSGRWYIEKYGPVANNTWWQGRTEKPVVIEIGPGAGVSAEYLLGKNLPNVNYLGVDISTSIVEANKCLRNLGGDPWFLQADILKAPLNDSCADFVFSEGVLHHTNNTREAVRTAARLVKPGGRLAFYVYKEKAPVREYTDDYIRSLIADLPMEAAWAKLMPLSKLGKALGELNQEITIEEDVEVLGITKGTYDIQRFFYWFVCKAYYRPEFTLDEMNHINFDWFTPKNCFRHSPDEVRGWIDELGFEVEWMRVEDAGITVVGKRP
jgi:arsenite methyltransferase